MSKATRNLFPMSVWDEASLLADFEEVGVKQKHLIKVLIKLYEDFSTGAIANLNEFEVPVGVPHKVYTVLRSGKYALMTTRVIKREDSRDGATTKILLELQDGHEVECVLMRYSNTFTGDHKRTTLCVSSQVGCAMACTFCATGTMGLSGNLFGGEIIEQFIWANEVERIRNVVFMGMGEPLNNYDAVLSAIRAMTNSQWFALQQKRVTLSTVGIVPRMFQLFDEAPFVTMALSLHAPTQPMRERIVPSARQYKLEDLVRAIDHYSAATKKDMLIEYVLLDDVNASDETAHLLGQLLRGRNVLVNVIPFNPVLTKARHVAPSPERVASFAQIVASYGVLVTARKELGQDISGACGQLAVKTKKEKKRSAAAAKAAAEDAGEAAPVKDTLLDTAVSDDDEEEDDDVDLIGNGLEGIASAMGVFNPASDDADAATAATVSTIADAEPTGCGSGNGSSPDGAVADLEDLAGTPAAAAADTEGVAAGAKGGLKAKKRAAAAAAAAAGGSNEEEVEAPLSAADDAKASNAKGHGCGDANCACSLPAPVRLTAEELAALCPHDRNDILPFSRWIIARGPVNKSLPASVERGLSHKVRRERLQAEAAAAGATDGDGDAAAEAAEAGDVVADSVSVSVPATNVPPSDTSDTTSTTRSLPAPQDRRVFFPKGGLKRADPLAPLPEDALPLDKLDAFTRVPEPAAEVDDASDDDDVAAAKLRRGRAAAAAAAAAASAAAFEASKNERKATSEQAVRERAPAAAWAALAVAAACAAGLYVRWMT